MAVVHRKFNQNKKKYLFVRLLQVCSVLFPAAFVIVYFMTERDFPRSADLLIAAMAAVLSIVCVRAFGKRAAILKSGITGEEETVRMLKALPDSWHILANPVFSVRGKVAELDAVAVGAQGVWIIETKNHSGTITGRPSDEYWHQQKRTETKQMKNPLLQAERQKRIVKELLSELGVQCPVHTAVYFANQNANPQVDDPRIFTDPERLMRQIRQDKKKVCKDPAALAKKLVSMSR